MQLGSPVRLKDFSSINIGGPSRYFINANSVGDIAAAIRAARERNIPIYIIGGGTNILWSDSGYPGAVLHPNINTLKIDGNILTAGAAVPMRDVVDAAVSRGLAGLEWAGGLPGTFGGAVIGNAGCFGGEIKDSIISVAGLNTKTLSVKTRTRGECGFAYRTSVFKENAGDEIVLSASLRLMPGDKRALYESVDARIRYRAERQPLGYPNIGSIFKNVPVGGIGNDAVAEYNFSVKTDPFPVVPAAHLIDRIGMKGMRFGGALVSEVHPNFIVNAGGAYSKDVIELMKIIKREVYNAFKINLEEEIRIIS